MSLLITGGTGFLGAALAQRLIARGEDVVLFDVLPHPERIANVKNKVKFVQGDLKVWPEVMNVIKENNVEGIFHFGSLLGGIADSVPWTAYQTNVQGSMHILEGARLFDVKRVVYASSISAFGLGISGVITDETIQRPVNFYGSGKVFIENLGRFYKRKFGLDFRGARYCSIISGAKGAPVVEHATMMIENTVNGRSYECMVSEDAKIPLMYLKDAALAAEMLYYAPVERIKTVSYNLVGVSPTPTAKELGLAVKKCIPEAQITFRPDKNLMTIYNEYWAHIKVYDDTRAREEWGWQPEYSDIEKLVADFMEEVKANPEIYERA